jgi:hypothetical protein
MSQTAYFMSDEEARILAELLEGKLDYNSPNYPVLHSVYERLTRGWTWNTDKDWTTDKEPTDD